MRRRTLAAWVAGTALVAGCSGAAYHETTPTTTAPPNPDVVPSVITPAYVDAVFAALEHVDGNASRALLAAHAVTPQVLRDIRAVYNDPLYAKEVQVARESLGGSLTNVRRPPGDVVITVSSLISDSSTCIFVETTSDYSKVLYAPGPPVAAEYWVLRPKQAGADPDRLNPTPWALAFGIVYKTPTTISDQCA